MRKIDEGSMNMEISVEGVEGPLEANNDMCRERGSSYGRTRDRQRIRPLQGEIEK